MERIWLRNYPAGVPQNVDVEQYDSLVHLMQEGFRKHAARNAYAYMDRHYTFGDIDRQSADFGAWLQGRGLARGARVAIMLPNVIQYPIALAGALRAGYVVVNVNPLYTPRELEHQLRDSGAEAIVILENFAGVLQKVIDRTAVKHVVIASMGEMLGFPKGAIVNFAVRRIKKMVPEYSLAGNVRFTEALDSGARRGLQPVQVGAVVARAQELHELDILEVVVIGGDDPPAKAHVEVRGLELVDAALLIGRKDLDPELARQELFADFPGCGRDDRSENDLHELALFTFSASRHCL